MSVAICKESVCIWVWNRKRWLLIWSVSQQEISKIEKQDEIEDGLLTKIAEVLGISTDVIKDFDVEKAICNINNYKDATISPGAIATVYAHNQQINPIEKVVELYERLLKSEQEKIEILRECIKQENNQQTGIWKRKSTQIQFIWEENWTGASASGMTQAELGDLLGITKQAVSKIEQTEKFDDERLGEIASALGVTVDGLKSFNEETILYNTNNFYENCGVKSAVSNTGNNQTFNSFPVEQVIEIFEKLLDKQKEQFETLKKRRNKYLQDIEFYQ